MNLTKLIKPILALVAVFLIFKLCTSNLGSVITLPGGMGGGTDSENTGGWLSPKTSDGDVLNTTTSGDKTVKEISKDLERQLGIGKEKGTTTTPSQTTTPSGTAASSSGALTFKGIPISGSPSAFGTKLVNAGFANAGNGTYTGDFAGYSRCKITPGGNPVSEVRVDFPVITDWDSLEKSYDALQASLTKKYGIEPTVATGSNKAVYNLSDGTITLDADVREQSTWHVILTYSNPSVTVPTTPSGRNPIDDL